MAELLITMGVLGAVAALTLPTITSNIWTSQLTKRATIESRKFTQAIENMVAFDDIAGKGSTERFVETLRNYLKIAKVCTEEHIADCWPTPSITLYDGQRFGIDQAGFSSVFNTASLAPKNRAIVTGDGTSMLLAYKTSCNKYSKNASVECVIGLMDSNGRKGPNKLGQDVVSLNMSKYTAFGKYDDLDSNLAIRVNAITCNGNQECSTAKINADFYASDQEETSGGTGVKQGFFDDSYWDYDNNWGKAWDDWD